MKRLNLSYINVICVFVLSFAVMEYVNLLIGRVGGFPVLAGVLVSYSVMRYGSFARKNMACYMGIYILTWFIGTVVLLSQNTQAGEISKSLVRRSISRHCTAQPCQRYGDIFCNCAHADSDCFTFPLTVIKSRKIYARYVLGDTLFGR